MSTTTTEPCPTCGDELTESICNAADQIYGPVASSFHERLLACLERAITRADTEPLLMTDPERDEHAGQSAVLEAFGFRDFASLVAAVRHYGHFGECRP